MRKLIRILTSLGLLLAVGAVIGVVALRRMMYAGETVLAKPEVSKPAGLALAKLCQSDPEIYSDVGVFPAWAPPDVSKLHPAIVHATTQSATAGFGGGFHHYGYELTLDPSACTATQNHWILNLYSEDSETKTIGDFSIDKSEHFELAEIIDNAMVEYHRRAASGISEPDVRDRIAFLLTHHQPARAIASIHDFADRYPHDWIDATLAFVLDSPKDAQAAVRLNVWSQKDNDFTTWLYAAYGYRAAGDMTAAERAVNSALQHPVIDPPWSHANARYRGSPMCLSLYESGNYQTCIALCDGLLAYTDSGPYRAGEIQAIRDLAKAAITHPHEPVKKAPPIQDGFDALEGIDLQKLTGAVPGTLPATEPVK